MLFYTIYVIVLEDMERTTNYLAPPPIDLNAVNKIITDRSDIFTWQSIDIPLAVKDAIWSDKHKGITSEGLLDLVNESSGVSLAEIADFDLDAQENLGFINSVRKGKLADGTEVIVRCHPRGVRNGYFPVESLAAQTAVNNGLPSYKTYAIHELLDTDDIAFQVIEKCPGVAVERHLEANPQDADGLMVEAGATMARLHRIKVNGFGPFDNEQAKQGQLVGLHDSYAKSVRAGLANSLRALLEYEVITTEQSDAIDELFDENSPLLQCEQGVLVHKDFADWNLLTDGNKITGILDWDECASGDPVVDIASWRSMAKPERVGKFLEGYFGEEPRPEHFDDKLELLTLRCTIDNMVQRVQRKRYAPADKMAKVAELVELGEAQMAHAFEYFGI